MTPVSVQSRRPQEAVTPATILFVTSAGDSRAGACGQLAAMGLEVTQAPELKIAVSRLAQQHYTLCLVDLADAQNALAAIRAIRSHEPELSIVGFVDPQNPLVTADAVQAGVTDLLAHPFEEREVASIVANARDREGISLTSVPAAPSGAVLFAHSATMRLVMDSINEAAAGDANVIVAGEAGTGRGLVCRALHVGSPRAQQPFVRIDCAGQTPDALELALFGTAPDRRTDPGRRRVERIARRGAIFDALGGTLYLANIAEAPDRIQAKLARLIRDREATLNEKRLPMPIDVRFMAGLDLPVRDAVSDGRLRVDLAERFSLVRIELPPLRRRREDIPVLAVHMLAELGRAKGHPQQRFTRSALALLSALPWPGNAQELRDVLELLVRAVRRPVIEIDDLFQHVRLDGVSARPDPSGSLRDARARFERDWISAVLVRHHGRVGEAARALGIQRTNLYRKVRQLNVARTLLASRRA